ncbi:MAG: TIGR03936 family radical SAM-associated protein, partial [Pseudonocardia sp.]
IDASRWSVELPGLDADAVRAAGAALWARESVVVERVTPSGRRQIDVRTALVRLDVDLDVANLDNIDTTDTPPASARMTAQSPVCAILTVVVRQTIPAVRPDDVLSALEVVAGLRPPVPPKATRMAQGLLDDRGDLADPLGSNRVTTRV